MIYTFNSVKFGQIVSIQLQTEFNSSTNKTIIKLVNVSINFSHFHFPKDLTKFPMRISSECILNIIFWEIKKFRFLTEFGKFSFKIVFQNDFSQANEFPKFELLKCFLFKNGNQFGKFYFEKWKNWNNTFAQGFRMF